MFSQFYLNFNSIYFTLLRYSILSSGSERPRWNLTLLGWKLRRKCKMDNHLNNINMQSVMIQWSECSIPFSFFWKSHCSPSSHDPLIKMFHFLFIVLKIPLVSMPSSHDPVMRMFHCLFIVLKIPLFSMISSYDPRIRMFHCLFIVLKIPLFSMSSSYDPVIRMFHCLFIVFQSLNPIVFPCSPCHPIMNYDHF